MRLKWYWQRLKVMGGRELSHRVQEQASLALLRIRQPLAGVWPYRIYNPDDFAFRNNTEMLPSPDFRGNRASSTQNDTSIGPGWSWQSDESWFIAPDTGNLWPPAFCSNVNHRVGNSTGDVRRIWEPARLQQLVHLARISRRTEAEGDRDLAAADLQAQLVSFYKANPPYLGVHYTSSMECALRILSICHTAALSREVLGDDRNFWIAVVNLVIHHALFIEKRLSLYSSAGNHTIAESAGLIYAGLLFSEHPRAAKWLSTGTELLESEFNRQILADGGGIEQAFWYQLFITDLAGLAADLLSHHARDVSQLAETLERSRQFISSMSSSYADAPDIGDRDDGYALSPDLAISWLGSATETERCYETSGYTVVQSTNERLIVDHGPLGMSPGFGHGHADALSIWLRVGDCDLLRSSGTFAYGGDQAWREHFRSTAAHNTLVINGCSQSRTVSPFQWQQGYKAELVENSTQEDGTYRLLMRHDGYQAIGCIHWRSVAYRPGCWLAVWDYVQTIAPDPQLPLQCTAYWHLGGRCELTQSACTIDNHDLRATVGSSGAMHLKHGETNPIDGWQSHKYGEKTPACTLQVDAQTALTSGLITLFTYNPDTTLTLENVENMFSNVRAKCV